MTAFVYLESEPGLYTVGHYAGETWEPESDHPDREAAAGRCNYLNGATTAAAIAQVVVEAGEALGWLGRTVELMDPGRLAREADAAERSGNPGIAEVLRRLPVTDAEEAT